MQDTSFHIRPNRDKALMLARRQLAELVCDAVNLEGIPFTLPEIQTLLDGVTVGGHKIADQQVAINQAKAWRYLFGLIEQQLFRVSMETACALHAIAGKDEALDWGNFRSGGVTIAGTSWLPPPADSLPALFNRMIISLDEFQDIYDRAIFLFLTMARTQFFYDVNKRTGRFMMSGLLLSHGFPLINLPAIRQLEFNELMLEFYSSNDQQPMNTFLRSCLDPRIIAIMNE
jgi:Fic family protein